LVKIGEKDWKKDWQKIGCFFLASFWLVDHSCSPSLVCHQHRRMEEEQQVEQGHLLEKKKPSGCLPGITEEMVEKYYHYSVSEAAEFLGAELGYRVDCRNLKRRLRDFGIERWPYQQVKHGPSRVRGASPTAVHAVADVDATQQHTCLVTLTDSPMGSAGLVHAQTEVQGGHHEHTFADDDVMGNDGTADCDQEYVRLVVSAFGDCKPSCLHVSADVEGDVAAFPWPEHDSGGDRLNWRRLYVTGVARVPVCHGDVQAGGDEDMLIFFCSCNEHGRQAWHMIQVMLLEPALATRDRWGEDSAHCAHAQCLEQCTRVWYPEVGVRALFEHSATHRTGNTSSQEDVSSDESITDLTEDHDSGWYDHTNSRRPPWPVHALGNVTVKQGARARTSSLHQVKNLAPGKLRSVGLLLDGKCKVCTSARCLHTSEYRKTCWNAPPDESQGAYPSS
jgi:hypothetical protein